MTDEQEKLSLATIKGGAVVEMFDRCLDEVLKNIGDPNTEAKPKRKIVLEVTFQATEDRAFIAIAISCNPKLLGQRSIVTSGFLKAGRFIENKPKQLGIFNNVHKIGGEQ